MSTASELQTALNDDRSEYRLVYSADHRVLRVRFVMWLAVGFFLLMSWATWQLVPMFESGIEPNGDPIGRGEVIALMAICQAFGWAFLVGMHLYGRCYVISIYRSPEGASQVYDTVGWFRPVPWFVTEDEEESTRFHRGRNRGLYSTNLDLAILQVDAPYYATRVRSRRLPFVVDGHGVFLEGQGPGEA